MDDDEGDRLNASQPSINRKFFDETQLQTDLSKSYRSQSYLTTKIKFLKSTVPHYNAVDIMGFDQLQSLKVCGVSKLQ